MMRRPMVGRSMMRWARVRLLSRSLALAWWSFEWVLEVREPPARPRMMWTIKRICNPGFKVETELMVFCRNLL